MAPKSAQQHKVLKKFTIDASRPVADKIFDINAFNDFLSNRIKVEGRTNNLRDQIQLSVKGATIEVVAHREFSGRYLKYLTKKYLKKNQLRDWIRVVSTKKGYYTLKFYNVADANEEDDEE